MFDMREIVLVDFADIASYARIRDGQGNWNGDLHLELLGRNGPAPGLYEYFEHVNPEINNLIEDFMDFYELDEFYWIAQ